MLHLGWRVAVHIGRARPVLRISEISITEVFGTSVLGAEPRSLTRNKKDKICFAVNVELK